MTHEDASLSETDLATAFVGVGLEQGDSVIVHSSFRSLGPVDGGPAAVVRALLSVLGPLGHLMAPTFNYSISIPQSYFDPASTPGRTGIISETIRARPGAVRSLSPTHSVAVIGPQAEALTTGHLDVRTCGIGSPIERLAKRGGKVLLIGVGNIVNTTVHVGEEYAGTPKAPWPRGLPKIPVLMPDGSIMEHQTDTSPSCSSAFGAVEYMLRKQALIRDLRLGSCKLQLMRGLDVIDCVCRMIEEKPDVLLCTYSQCGPCSGARNSLRAAGLIP